MNVQFNCYSVKHNKKWLETHTQNNLCTSSISCIETRTLVHNHYCPRHVKAKLTFSSSATIRAVKRLMFLIASIAAINFVNHTGLTHIVKYGYSAVSWTNQDAVWDAEMGGSMEHVLHGVLMPQWDVHF